MFFFKEKTKQVLLAGKNTGFVCTPRQTCDGKTFISIFFVPSWPLTENNNQIPR